MIIHPKFIYLEIPCADGDFVYNYLRDNFSFAVETKHRYYTVNQLKSKKLSPDENINLYEINTNHIPIFTFVRNPFDWYTKLWAYKFRFNDKTIVDKDLKIYVMSIYDNIDVKEDKSWNNLSDVKLYNSGVYTTILNNILSEDAIKGINVKIYKAELVRADLIRALERSSVSLKDYDIFNILNKGISYISEKWKDYRYEYDEELKSMIEERDRKALDFLEYSF